MKHDPSNGVDDFGQTRYRRISPMSALFIYFLKASFWPIPCRSRRLGDLRCTPDLDAPQRRATAESGENLPWIVFAGEGGMARRIGLAGEKPRPYSRRGQTWHRPIFFNACAIFVGARSLMPARLQQLDQGKI